MSIETIIERLRQTKAGHIALHVLLWLFYFGALYYLGNISTNKYPGDTAIMEYSKHTFTVMIVFYPLVYWVWPKYWMKKKYLQGILLIVLLIILYATVAFYIEQAILSTCEICMEQIKKNQNGYYDLLQKGAFSVIFLELVTLGIVYQLFLFLSFPLGVKILFENFKQRIATMRLKQENIQLEFNFLKAQVNPHFLFNTLNNIYALILKDKKEESAETVAKLSTFMRYTLYESDTHSNNIIKEIDLLKAYISLEQIRLNDVVVNFTSNVDNEQYHLPPLLFIPVIENAFKFCSKTKNGDAYIFIKLEIAQSQLLLRIANTYDEAYQSQQFRGGIGLENMRKRLQHYYPGKNSSISITEENNIFTITIQLNLATQ